MRTYKNYLALKKEYTKQIQGKEKATCFYIVDAWRNENQTQEKTRYIEQYLTQREKETLTSVEQCDLIIKKVRKYFAKQRVKMIEKLDLISKIERTDYISIDVHYAHNKTWGLNPSARVETTKIVNYGRASGWGYDKLGSSIAYALNKNEQTLKLLCDLCEQTLRQGKDLLSLGCGCSTSGIVPSFTHCVDYRHIREIFQRMGAKVNTWQSGKDYESMFIQF